MKVCQLVPTCSKLPLASLSYSSCTMKSSLACLLCSGKHPPICLSHDSCTPQGSLQQGRPQQSCQGWQPPLPIDQPDRSAGHLQEGRVQPSCWVLQLPTAQRWRATCCSLQARLPCRQSWPQTCCMQQCKCWRLEQSAAALQSPPCAQCCLAVWRLLWGAAACHRGGSAIHSPALRCRHFQQLQRTKLHWVHPEDPLFDVT